MDIDLARGLEVGDPSCMYNIHNITNFTLLSSSLPLKCIWMFLEIRRWHEDDYVPDVELETIVRHHMDRVCLLS